MARDPKVEQWLDKQGVQYRLQRDVPLDKFDREASRQNQARLGHPLDQDRVEQMALAMIDSVEFPAAVAYQLEGGKLMLISGNHRINAAVTAEVKGFDVYVVTVPGDDRYLIDLLTRTANNIEGVAPTRQEQVLHAMHLITTYRRSPRQVAEDLHLPSRIIEDAVRASRVQERLVTIGRPYALTHVASLNRLHAVSDDDVLGDVVDLAREAKFTTEMVDGIVKAVRTEHTVVAQRRVVEMWRSRPDIAERIIHAKGGAGTRKPRFTQRQNFFKHLTGLEGLVSKANSLDELQVTNQTEFQRMVRVWAVVRTKIDAFVRDSKHRPSSKSRAA